jgi:hypothetical protein
MNRLDIETLRLLVRADFETGKIFWNERDVSFFPDELHCRQWNSRLAGKQAFTAVGDHGYQKGTILNRWFRAHRVIWALYHGEWPSGQIDHINGDRADNRISNLRVVSAAENGRNQKIRNTNSSGVMGVNWHPKLKKWVCVIKPPHEKNKKHIGVYTAFDEAVKARKDAERRYGYHQNHGAR